MSRGREVFKDLIFTVIAVVFIISLWCVLDMEPKDWIPIAGLYVSGSLLFPVYNRLFRKEYDRKHGRNGSKQNRVQRNAHSRS